ncbi:Arf/Sar family, other [Angomonas deanei]|uniref:ADP-ribosylation factor family/Signal recognition particle receptor beta subunit/50S ribosome-binding GTPase/Ras of Complex, Roc, domain of DAPkinase/Ras family, putative n=1 Tax=Angomonas deanei TaxID=59799 RepID=S9U324_9TRYP|nr:Arf/Sar family, other [Angomonas deanei]EPY27113.1 Arf/Sar family, other [Angomonas deanei]EPY42063.1 Arf/Sar family, other [Angomonas deanei]CAD2219455.1 ADP-ribosylation factor family/Signal recognition particle receptor beta subunit/50S ribosome-binding GTPase/Ras of Complex, Roc, domain of DAPkinase/Ras family, putative [Angomonas deanei]|eukprot:EPY25192.1 Arf/Sar family, other [Angomonas deanei]
MGQSKTKVSIIVCGLDNSGKSTILNHFKPDKEKSETINATLGYTTEQLTLKYTPLKQAGGDQPKARTVECTAFDMGGAKKFRTLWESYYNGVDGVVFVVDSADALRMSVVKDEIQQMLENADLSSGDAAGVPVLFFANKMDIQNAKNPAELTEILELADIIVDRPYNIFASDARKGVGLEEGMQWLQSEMLKRADKAKAKK